MAAPVQLTVEHPLSMATVWIIIIIIIITTIIMIMMIKIW